MYTTLCRDMTSDLFPSVSLQQRAEFIIIPTYMFTRIVTVSYNKEVAEIRNNHHHSVEKNVWMFWAGKGNNITFNKCNPLIIMSET